MLYFYLYYLGSMWDQDLSALLYCICSDIYKMHHSASFNQQK